MPKVSSEDPLLLTLTVAVFNGDRAAVDSLIDFLLERDDPRAEALAWVKYQIDWLDQVEADLIRVGDPDPPGRYAAEQRQAMIRMLERFGVVECYHRKNAHKQRAKCRYCGSHGWTRELDNGDAVPFPPMGSVERARTSAIPG